MYIASAPAENQGVIASDFSTLEKIKLILSKKNPVKQDFEMLSKYLIELIRLDDGTSDNIVGKFIGASLINDKMNGHFQKLDGMLQSAGESIETITTDQKQMQRYEDSIYLINNLGEMRTALGFTENYLYRILEGTQIIEKNG
jgi:chaperonin cofactor prefoldin